MRRPIYEEMVLNIDGASFGNPGPAGAGIVLTAGNEVIHRASIPLGETTNNVAEYRALIAGLHEAAARKARRVVVRSDSELLIRQMRGEYQVKAPHLRPLHEWGKKIADRFEGVTWEYVPREENSEADRLAKEGAESSRGRLPEA
ncbi:MAG: ribonuclease HI family protein [Armatimonadota bacterium]